MKNASNERELERLFPGDSELAGRMRRFDWSSNPLGLPASWSQSLKTAVRIMLTSRQPMWLGWGGQLIKLYNDAYKSIVGGKHPEALGQPASIVWREIWDEIAPRLESAMRKHEGTYDEAVLLIMERYGYQEETYYTFSFSPIPDDQGGTGGILCANTDDTRRVIGERQLALLRELAARTADARSFDAACASSAAALDTNPHDIPFALIYLIEPDKKRAVLAGTSGIERGHGAALESVGLAANSVWPFAEVIANQAPYVISDLAGRIGGLPTGAWRVPPHHAIAAPIAAAGQTGKAGVLIMGLNPFRLFDDSYRGFVDLVSAQIAASIGNAQAYEEERKRAEALAELDRAKTAFFSNVSHEFRTPLTLMLGPLEELKNEFGHAASPLSVAQYQQLDLVHRNSLRLLKLVNTLLDFSRIEAGRTQAVYEETDLAVYTAELASVFRSAIEKAGLKLIVDCPPLSERAFVDREMWEKIVLNLLSNAFKYTFKGEIEVSLRPSPSHLAAEARFGHVERGRGKGVILSVRDTGIGIAEDQAQKVFERFHRVPGARGRTFEGTGIGLALVQELAHLHGGSVSVESEYGKGSTFRVLIPLGKSHLPEKQMGGARTRTSTATGAMHYVEEALRWLPETDRTEDLGLGTDFERRESDLVPGPRPSVLDPRPRIVVADDNADMRDYVARLLSARYEVAAVADGEAALEAIAKRAPDLVLSDIMMPGLDGFGLLERLRADERTKTIPVILLSARAGEESRVEGLHAGADDYLIKPFSGRELAARVETHLRMAALRREAEKAIRQSEHRFSRFMEHLPGLAWTKDLGGRYLYANDHAKKVFGKTGEQLHGRTDDEIFPAESAAQFKENDLRALTSDAGVQVIESLRHADGNLHHSLVSKFPIRGEDGAPLAIGGMAIDITERQIAEEELREQQERWKLAAQVGRFGQWQLDLATSALESSQLCKANFGLGPEDELSYQRLFELIHPEDRDGVRARVTEAIAEHRFYEAEYRVIWPDGGTHWINARGSAFYADDGTPSRMIGVTLDVTERKQTEEALRQADRRKDEFLATLAHELRNPLAPIRNSLNILHMTGGSGPATQRVIEMMERQVNHMVRLVDDLMEVSRITRGQIELRKERIELASVIRSAIETAKPEIESVSHEVHISIPREPVLLEADPVRLAQVFSNLLNNAAKYTDPRGQIWVDAKLERDGVTVSVRDTGIGIAADMLPRVFDAFTRANKVRAQGGMGIGLSLVRSLLKLHGGSVEAKSEGEGKGSEFIVRLPVAAARAQEFTRPSEYPARPVSPRRILVADDNRDAADSLGMLLRFTGADAHVVYDGPAALAALETYQPGIVLLDIGMPEMDGIEVARRIRQHPEFKNVTIIALTGWGQEQDRRLTRAAGFDHHLIKPADINALEALLASLEKRA